MESKQAAAYLGVSLKSLSTREWRDEHGVPYSYIGGKLAFDRRWAARACVARAKELVLRAAARPPH